MPWSVMAMKAITRKKVCTGRRNAIAPEGTIPLPEKQGTCPTKTKVRYARTFMRSAFFGFLLCCLSVTAQTNTYVLKAARLFDGKSDAAVTPGLVVVSNGKIQSVGGSAPAGVTVIDLGDATLLPGFIDAHTHLTMDFNPDYNGARLDELSRTIPELAIRSTANARKTLM